MLAGPVDKELPFIRVLIEPISHSWNSGGNFEYELKNGFHPLKEALIVFNTVEESSEPFVSSRGKVIVISLEQLLEKAQERSDAVKVLFE